MPTVANDVAGSNLLGSALDTLPSNIAIIDTDGRILASNSSWREFAEDSDIQMAPATIDVNYLDVTDAADDPDAERAAAGLRAVLAGERERFELEYPCHSPDERQRFLFRAAAFTHDGERYATVTYIDITEQRQRERALREAYEISASDRPFTQKVDELLELGRDVLGLAFGTLSYVEDEEYTFEAVATPDDADLSAGETAPLETLPNCEQVVEAEETLVLRDVDAEAPALADPEWGITAYLGAPVVVDGEVHGTFCFYSMEARSEAFSEWEVTFIELLSSWVSSALEQRHYTDILGALEAASPDLAFLLDAEGRYLDYLASSEMTDHLVTEPDEFLDQTLHDVLLSETADELLATTRAAIDAGECQTVEYKLDVPAGTRWFEAYVAPVAHGVYGPNTAVFVARDITERKEREQSLHATKERLQAIITASLDPIIVLDHDGTVQLWNDAAEEVFDYASEEVRGEPLFDVGLHSGDDRGAFQERFERILAGESITGLEVTRQTRDGDTIHLSISAAPVRRPDGTITGVVAVAKDVTEHKTREQELRKTGEMLRSVQQTMASSASLREKVEELLAFGQDYLGVEQGFFARIDDKTMEIRTAVGPNEQLQAGASIPLAETYCRHTVADDTADPLVVEHASEEDWPGDSAFERFGLECYVGATIRVDGESYGTICFADRVPAEGGFTKPQQTFVDLLSEWVSYELVQRDRERQYRRLTERISDAYYAFDADWTVTYWNNTVADRSGVPAEEIVGTNFWEQFPKVEGTEYAETLRKAMQSQEPQSCEYHYEEGGYWVSVQVHPDEEGISVISQEITERKEHEQELERQRDALAQLQRLNTLVRELIQALQDTTTREAIEMAVCNRLTESALYENAWIGVQGATVTGDQTVIPQTAAGIDTADLEGNPAFEDPATTAIQTGDVQVVDDIATPAAFPDDRQERKPEHDHHALAAVPLTTGEVNLGVLVILHPGDQIITDGEQAILADLGQMIAQAIQRVNSQQALSAETVVRLDLRLPDTDLLLGEVSTKFDCELALKQRVSTSDGGVIYYFSVHDADPEQICEFLRETPLECDCTVVRETSDDQPPLIELRFDEQPHLPTDVLSTYGGSMTTVRIADGNIFLGVELPPAVDVRSVVDTLHEVAPGIELISKQYVDQPIETGPTLQTPLTEDLTSKQQAALEVAYARGYYAWPRESTAEDLANTMDISSPTLHYHLRHAIHRLLSPIFGERDR